MANRIESNALARAYKTIRQDGDGDKKITLGAAGVLTVTNDTNVGDFDKFCLILTINPNSIITTAPVDYTVTVNGTAVPIWDKWGYPITTDRLCTRKCYVGRYIDSATPHITLTNALSNNATNGVLGS